jgi:hypothetical protein
MGTKFELHGNTLATTKFHGVKRIPFIPKPIIFFADWSRGGLTGARRNSTV